jgi:hypothetical protein
MFILSTNGMFAVSELLTGSWCIARRCDYLFVQQGEIAHGHTVGNRAETKLGGQVRGVQEACRNLRPDSASLRSGCNSIHEVIVPRQSRGL